MRLSPVAVNCLFIFPSRLKTYKPPLSLLLSVPMMKLLERSVLLTQIAGSSLSSKTVSVTTTGFTGVESTFFDDCIPVLHAHKKNTGSKLRCKYFFITVLLYKTTIHKLSEHILFRVWWQ